MSAAVRQLCLGTAQLGMAYGIASVAGAPSAAQAAAVLAAAVDLGIRAFDTAPGYGSAELRLGAFLAARATDVFAVGTKLPSLRRRGVAASDVASCVERDVTTSLRALRVARLDTYLVHDLADVTQYGAALVDALAQQRDAGRIAEIGVSAYAPADLAAIEPCADLTVVQHPLSLLDRRLLGAGWPERFERAGRKVHVRSILLQGLLAMDPEQAAARLPRAAATLRALERALSACGTSAVAVALPFVLSLEPARVVIGAEDPGQLEALVASAGAAVPQGLGEALAALGAIPDDILDPRTWTAGH